MPVNDWHMLVGMVIGIVVLFAVVIVLTLRFATRNQARLLRETRARDVLAGIGLSNTNREHLLYGVWQTTMTEVILQVRAGNDHEVGSIVQRVFGGTITAGSDQYTLVFTSRWRESAMLVRADNQAAAATPLCRYEVRGWAAAGLRAIPCPTTGYSASTHAGGLRGIPCRCRSSRMAEPLDNCSTSVVRRPTSAVASCCHRRFRSLSGPSFCTRRKGRGRRAVARAERGWQRRRGSAMNANYVIIFSVMIAVLILSNLIDRRFLPRDPEQRAQLWRRHVASGARCRREPSYWESYWPP